MLQIDIESSIKFDENRPAVHALADSGHARVMLVCLKAGQSLKDHRSASQVIVQFIKGRGLFFADGVPAQAAPGSLILLEANRFHRLEAVEDCVALVIMAPHPAREGYPRGQVDRIIPRSGPHA